jgi:hypothetical protein
MAWAGMERPSAASMGRLDMVARAVAEGMQSRTVSRSRPAPSSLSVSRRIMAVRPSGSIVQLTSTLIRAATPRPQVQGRAALPGTVATSTLTGANAATWTSSSSAIVVGGVCNGPLGNSAGGYIGRGAGSSYPDSGGTITNYGTGGQIVITYTPVVIYNATQMFAVFPKTYR